MKKLVISLIIIFTYSLSVFAGDMLNRSENNPGGLHLNNGKTFYNPMLKLMNKHEEKNLAINAKIENLNRPKFNDFSLNSSKSIMLTNLINKTEGAERNSFNNKSKISNSAGSGAPWWAVTLIVIGSILVVAIVYAAVFAHK